MCFMEKWKTRYCYCIMDFSFIGGSMGSVVGEKISRAIDFEPKRKNTLF